jgi:hypothetical protein
MELKHISLRSISFEGYNNHLKFWGLESQVSQEFNFCEIINPLIYPNYRSIIEQFLEDSSSYAINVFNVFEKNKSKTYPREYIKRRQILKIEEFANNEEFEKSGMELYFRKTPQSNIQSLFFRKYGDQIVNYGCHLLRRRLSNDANIKLPRKKFCKGIWTPYQSP